MLLEGILFLALFGPEVGHGFFVGVDGRWILNRHLLSPSDQIYSSAVYGDTRNLCSRALDSLATLLCDFVLSRSLTHLGKMLMDTVRFDRCGRRHKCWQLRQQFNCDSLVLQHHVGVDVHREIDIGVASETLRHLRRDAGLG